MNLETHLTNSLLKQLAKKLKTFLGQLIDIYISEYNPKLIICICIYFRHFGLWLMYAVCEQLVNIAL